MILSDEADDEDRESVDDGDEEEAVEPMPLVPLPLLVLPPPIETMESRSLEIKGERKKSFVCFNYLKIYVSDHLFFFCP